MQKKLDTLFAAIMLALGVAVVLTGLWCLSHSIAQARKAEPVVIVRYVPAPAEPEPALAVEVTEAPQDSYNPAIPLSPPLQEALNQACEEAGVPVALALGLIEVESCFQADAVSTEGCYGLMQLNPLYFPDKLSPADNIREGIVYLGRLLERYGDPAAALTAYNAGYDTGYRGYANAVLAAAEWWEGELE